jgi:hypothetical protein
MIEDRYYTELTTKYASEWLVFHELDEDLISHIYTFLKNSELIHSDRLLSAMVRGEIDTLNLDEFYSLFTEAYKELQQAKYVAFERYLIKQGKL